MLNISNSFVIQDFIPNHIYKRYKDKSIRFINPKVVSMAECLRNRFNSDVVINNWHKYNDGEYYFNFSGYRPPDCKKGSFMSRHKQGLAIDIKIRGLLSSEIEEDIIKNYDLMYKQSGLTTIEFGNKYHVHLSCEWTMTDQLNIIKKVEK
jgi:hypothetical protein